MFTKADVAEVRHVVQRILVPCVFVIGLLGNSVSIYVLTRRRMRCTTNIYLTALAITDIIYLTMALLLSLQHYQSVHLYCELYWMNFGVVVWLCDACAYISIYIAVCFTIERFIAIRYPLKRQTFCTESLAKKVIAGVALFCLLSTISTAFEHQYRIDFKLMDSHGEPCNETLANADLLKKLEKHEIKDSGSERGDSGGSGGGGLLENPVVSAFTNEIRYTARALVAEQEMESGVLASSLTSDIPNIRPLAPFMEEDYLPVEEIIEVPVHHKDLQRYIDPWLGVSQQQHQKEQQQIPQLQQHQQQQQQQDTSYTFNVTAYCQNVTYYKNSPSSLAKNEVYLRIWYFFTLFVFVLIPLCVLATFNCFLIMLVRRSKTVRGEMTNVSSMRRAKRKHHISTVSQENRVTVTLIAVVLLFIVCQLPWAIYLIVSEQMAIDVNLQMIIGNICNFLAATNAASNFFLYCVLSDKYRRTVREMITGYRYRQQRSTLNSVSLYTNASRRSHRTTTSSELIK